MKKYLYTLIAAMMAATNLMAQHAPMAFAGESVLSVATTIIENPKDTIMFTMTGMNSGDITLPEMKGMGTIPSFTISGVCFTMDENHVVTFPEQTFSTSVEVDGTEKSITGLSFSGTYTMADRSMEIVVTFKYGSMPFPMTYSFKGYYVKDTANGINVLAYDKNTNSNAYGLNGQRVSNGARGIVIIGGKKYLKR